MNICKVLFPYPRKLFPKYLFIHIKRYSSQTESQGWVTAVRKFKDFSFIHISDGCKHETLQVLVKSDLMSSDISYGSCVRVKGEMIASPGPQQPQELQATHIHVLGKCDVNEFPFKKNNKETPDDIRLYPHLRPKTNFIKSLLRVRNAAFMAIHKYFQTNDYIFIHTPILTSNDCEGAGQIFSLQEKVKCDGEGDFDHFFFGKPVHLTVSGQLHLEAITGGISKCYTVSPTFRKEKSHTRHHLAEFYMVEAELAFTKSLDDIMAVMEDLIKFITKETLDKVSKDIDFLHKRNSTDRKKTADVLLDNKFIRLSYDDALKMVQAHKQFSTIKWGNDFNKKQEKYVVQQCGNIPVFVTDFPVELKPFYCRQNDDSVTASAVDLLLPEVGELFGGSLREERYDTLKEKLTNCGILNTFEWYLDLRKYGTCPHGGFGMGFDRYLQYLLNMQTVKDTASFPRSHMNCKL